MSKRRAKSKMLETAFMRKANTAKPAFNFFKSCLSTSRPEWGPTIFQFKLPHRISKKHKN